MRKKVYALVSHTYFDVFLLAVIIFNVGVMASIYYDAPEAMVNTFDKVHGVGWGGAYLCVGGWGFMCVCMCACGCECGWVCVRTCTCMWSCACDCVCVRVHVCV